jgi:hypothetical protein
MNRMVKSSVLIVLVAVFSVYSFAQQTQTQEKKDIKFVKAPNSPAPAGVKFAISEPTDGQVVPGPDVTVKFKMRQRNTGSTSISFWIMSHTSLITVPIRLFSRMSRLDLTPFAHFRVDPGMNL